MSKAVSPRIKAKKSTTPMAPKKNAGRFIAEECFQEARDEKTLPIFVVSVDDYPTWLSSAPAEIQSWLGANHFKAKAGACALLPQLDGCAGAVITVSDPCSPWQYAGLVKVLPMGSFEAEPELDAEVASALSLGWLLSSYHFDRYKAKPRATHRFLVWPEEAPRSLILALGEGICLCRDLINTPASDMGPEELVAAGVLIAKSHGAKVTTIVGDALIEQNYPMIHAVGRASNRAPRLLDFRWGKSSAPLLTLVGKGVCFDTGGLDLKPAQFMKLMKKDMGGAALVLGLAHAIMREKLPIQLRVLIPAVENSVSGNAMRPLDVLSTRKGITVEVGDTDAEGRLILGDALYEAVREKPDLLIDAATLTGAARVALGTEIPAVFSNLDSTWNRLYEASSLSYDPLWRLPLFDGYRRKLDSQVADISNISSDSYGGAITAALFLREFVSREQDWLHIDTMGYNLDARPGRPAGGEGLALLTVFKMLQLRYGTTAASASAQEPEPAPSSSTAMAARKGKNKGKKGALPSPQGKTKKSKAKSTLH